MLPWRLLGALMVSVSGRDCFTDAIPEMARQNVVVDDVSMPIGIWSGDWGSAMIVSSIYQILVQEKLGFNISINTGTTSYISPWKLAGCDHDPESNNITGGCGSTRYHHVAVEYWYTNDPELPVWLAELGEYAPEGLGSTGYSGRDGMYVMPRVVSAALSDSGLALEYYRSYNRSWYDPAKYTATVAEVDLTKLKTCAESVEIGYKTVGEEYFKATGDADGVEEKNGTKVLKCIAQKWWPAPACRDNFQGCVAIITGRIGWGMDFMTQQAFFHNMPVAFATAVDYQALNLELDSLLYWWEPDTAFALQKPYELMFPPHSPSQWKQGITKTMQENIVLSTWIAKGFAEIAHRPVAVASNLKLTDETIQALLVAHLQGDTQDYWDTACNWLLQSQKWKEWLPKPTACSNGNGLIDAEKKFVQDIDLAVNCALCPVGSRSVVEETTRVCKPCDPGFYQPMPGESECLPCEAGSRSDQTGQSECAPCGLGRFANDTAMTSCYQCGPADQAERWTTSEEVVSSPGQKTWIQIQAAKNESHCRCVEGMYLWNGRCEVCIEGSACPGSNELLLLPGYFSRPEAPGEVFRCFGDSRRCPGGRPGTCADGRDSNSLSCSSCLKGLRGTEDVCIPCASGDYALLVLLGLLSTLAIALLYLVLVNEAKSSKQPGSLLIAALGLGQMVTVVQQLTVIQQFKIEWGQPFSSVLEVLELLAFDLDLISIACVVPMGPVMKFGLRTLLVLLFFAVAGIVHCAYLACQRAKTFRISLLARTVGTMFLVLYISLCSSLLAPFRCNLHPNGRWTVQSYDEVLCDGTDEHLHMAVIGGIACLIPASFLAICVWIIIFELPKRLEMADVHFIRACSFLFMRFRPGAEVFSVIFLARNALVVLCPLLPSSAAKVVCMNLLLYGSVVVTAFWRPWRAPACNFLDLVLVTGMLVILDMGSLFVTKVDIKIVTAICMVFFSLMVLAIFGAIVYGIAKHFLSRYRKQFRFFLCHQKVAAGSLARLLKMELQKRGPRFNTFVDCDDLTDLTRLFNYVGQDTETLVVLGSPEILTRKWCVGEMCTARVQRVQTVVLVLPGYVSPDKAFIESYSSIVPDVTQLANYNMGLAEVEETLRWISTVPNIRVPLPLTPDAIDSIGNQLTGHFRKKAPTPTADPEPECVILADMFNSEATATAFILLNLILHKLVGGRRTCRDSFPIVLEKGEALPKTTTSALMICSEGCFRSTEVASWLIAASNLATCCVLPIVAEDGFRFPSQSFYDDLITNQHLAKLDLEIYVRIIEAVFQEIAVVFSPQNYSSTQEDLELRSKQIVWRLQSGALKPLASKLEAPSAKIERLPSVTSEESSALRSSESMAQEMC